MKGLLSRNGRPGHDDVPTKIAVDTATILIADPCYATEAVERFQRGGYILGAIVNEHGVAIGYTVSTATSDGMYPVTAHYAKVPGIGDVCDRVSVDFSATIRDR